MKITHETKVDDEVEVEGEKGTVKDIQGDGKVAVVEIPVTVIKTVYVRIPDPPPPQEASEVSNLSNLSNSSSDVSNNETVSATEQPQVQEQPPVEPDKEAVK